MSFFRYLWSLEGTLGTRRVAGAHREPLTSSILCILAFRLLSAVLVSSIRCSVLIEYLVGVSLRLGMIVFLSRRAIADNALRHKRANSRDCLHISKQEYSIGLLAGDTLLQKCSTPVTDSFNVSSESPI